MGGKNRQWAAALACGLGVSLTGAAYSWITPLMTILVESGSPVPMTTSDTSWLAASIEISAFVCTIPIGLLSDRWGRKYLLVAIGPLNLVSYICIIATRSIEALYAARIVQGVALGLAYVVGPMYMAEIAEPADRGKISGIFQPAFYAGGVYSVSLGAFVSYENFAIAQLVPVGVFIVAMALLPESPYYLTMRGKNEEAIKALTWLRCKNIDHAREEFKLIAEGVEEDKENNGTIKDLFRTRRDRKSFFLVQAVCIVKYLSGSTAIVVYVSETFSEVIKEDIAGEIFTIVFMVLLVVSSLLSSVVSDLIGRRPLLLFSAAASGTCSVIVAVLFFLNSNTSVNVRGFIWIAIISMSGVPILSNFGVGSLAQTVQAEYFPSNTRAIGGSVTQMIAAAGAYINLRQYQLASDLAGVYLNYWIFAAVSYAGFVLFYFLIPETKGQTLSEIQKTFS